MRWFGLDIAYWHPFVDMDIGTVVVRLKRNVLLFGIAMNDLLESIFVNRRPICHRFGQC